MKFNLSENMTEITTFIVLQLMNILFSLSSVLIKVASSGWARDGLWRLSVIVPLSVAVIILGVYALLWQMILSRIDLTTAYMCKGMTVFWGLLWALVLFNETITAYNAIGTIIIFIGTVLVTVYE